LCYDVSFKRSQIVNLFTDAVDAFIEAVTYWDAVATPVQDWYCDWEDHLCDIATGPDQNDYGWEEPEPAYDSPYNVYTKDTYPGGWVEGPGVLVPCVAD
jgi:hypothetical protein